ncbi:MAG TPA: metalloregulator ArsR/SmtB family transcription factor [Anaerolineae bacterium]|jgi:ArsR family transcriptional regulator|nr:metalloregulator ArsR/SmtB family transcription factor [Anaerolineae bacterium]
MSKAIFKLHAEIFRVLSNPLRHEIFHRLAEREMTVSELVEACDAKKSNVSQHLSLLSTYKLVESRKEGKNVYFSVSYPELAQACQLIDTILKDQLRKDYNLFEGGVV